MNNFPVPVLADIGGGPKTNTYDSAREHATRQRVGVPARDHSRGGEFNFAVKTAMTAGKDRHLNL